MVLQLIAVIMGPMRGSLKVVFVSGQPIACRLDLCTLLMKVALVTHLS